MRLVIAAAATALILALSTPLPAQPELEPGEQAAEEAALNALQKGMQRQVEKRQPPVAPPSPRPVPVSDEETVEAADAAPTGRLEADVLPGEYDLRMTVDPRQSGFSGTVRIAAKALRAVRRITLHAKGLEIKRASVNGRVLAPGAVRLNPKAQTAELNLPQALAPGPAEIELDFAGRFDTQMRGLYESRAKVDGREERYAFTQLEPTGARQVFPCFDEPAFKAAFRLTVTAPAGLTVLSNMPAEKRSEAGGMQTVAFGRTPRMSTYLLAIAVARLIPKGRPMAGTEVTVWALPQDIGNADFALDSAEQALTRLNDYFGIPYQLPKLDLVAVPDFASGAMENWGASFFRDSSLLADPKRSSALARRRVAEVVTHEIVHQWFGNLVTMKWWDDLWLNEAFATWMTYKLIDEWRPEWQPWISFEQRKREPLAIDALRSTRAIASGAVSAAEIDAMFDPLTYSKGGAVLRMMHSLLGEKAFRAGLRSYMARYQYGNTAADDLWGELAKASGTPVTEIARGWLTRPGYPLVTIEPASPDGLRLRLSQKRFSASGPALSAPPWAIPMAFKYKLKGEDRPRTHRILLKSARGAITLPGSGEVLWVYPNSNESGFYRFRLDEGLLANLAGRAGKDLAPLERMGLLSNLWAQARSGELALPVFLETLRAFKDDGSRAVVTETSAYLKTMADALAADPADRAGLGLMTEDLLGPHWRRLGWEPASSEDDETKLARAAALSALGSVAPSPELAAQLRTRLKDYWTDPARLDPSLVSAVLALNARLGPPELFDTYRERLARAKTPEERDQYLRAMADFRKPELARKLLEMTLTAEIRGQDAAKPVSYLLSDPATQGEAWEFVKRRWADLRRKAGPRGAKQMIGATASLWDRKRLEEVGTFFAQPANREETADRALAQSLELIELGIGLREAQSAALSRWLKANYPTKS